MTRDSIPLSLLSSYGNEFSDKKPLNPGIDDYAESKSPPYPSNTRTAQVSFERNEQQQETGSARRHHVFRFWPWEAGSVALALGLIAATYSILSRYDRERVPDWPFSINLNTLVSLISTIMRAAMLVGITEVISQTKWDWFTQRRPLSHLQYFDQASRAVSGAVTLLFVAPTSFLGVLGALVAILSLGMGPFTQQAVKTVPCVYPREEIKASLPLAHFVPGSSSFYRIGAGLYEAQVDMKGAMINGIVNPTGNDSAIVATCPTGNCTFPSYSSIGMCSSCIDTTSLVSVSGSDEQRNLTLPNQLWVSPSSDRAYLNVAADNMSYASSLFSPEFAAVSNAALANITVLALTNTSCTNNMGTLKCPVTSSYGGETGYVATSCSLYPCLKNYEARLENGFLAETVISTEPAPLNLVEAGTDVTTLNPLANYTALKTPCLLDGEWYDLSNFQDVPTTPGREFAGINVDGANYTAPNECLYKMVFMYGSALKSFMVNDLFKGACTWNSRQADSIACGDKWWLSPLYQDKQASFATLSKTFDQFATVMTNKFRTTGVSNYDDTTPEIVRGLAVEMTVCTAFEWEWLLMPTFLVAVTAALLIITIVQNRRDHNQPVWKSSVLPLLFHGFGQPHDGPRAAMDLDQLAAAAANTQARFQSGADAGFVDISTIRRRDGDAGIDSLR
ncbi:hypothetical protein F5B20DRAFT_592082 [Whalleya microplaca]|nr:hypothetical protein F5B20DRAFT_592082 [Whalleya microplaca]